MIFGGMLAVVEDRSLFSLRGGDEIRICSDTKKILTIINPNK